MPLEPRLGLGVAAGILVAWCVWTLSAVRRREPARSGPV
jgi:hypothetical protein